VGSPAPGQLAVAQISTAGYDGTMTTSATLTKPEADFAAPARQLPDGRGPLTNQDRCDSCGAQAYLAAVVNGTELLFCGHHANKGESRLIQLATSWHDERAKLYG